MDFMKVARTRKRRIVKLKGDDLENCPICQYTLCTRRPVVYLPCGHSLHLRCEKKMRESLCASCNHCPICRHIIDPSADFLNVEVDDLVSYIERILQQITNLEEMLS
jgi:hypothetical protein